MRYALRNQKKIAEHYSGDMLKSILDAASDHFKQIDPITAFKVHIEGEKYATLKVTNKLEFYITGQLFDVIHLALKKVI